MVKMNNITRELRSAIKRSGGSLYAIARRAGLAYNNVHGFAGGTRDMTLSSATKLAAALDSEIRLVTKKRKRR